MEMIVDDGYTEASLMNSYIADILKISTSLCKQLSTGLKPSTVRKFCCWLQKCLERFILDMKSTFYHFDSHYIDFDLILRRLWVLFSQYETVEQEQNRHIPANIISPDNTSSSVCDDFKKTKDLNDGDESSYDDINRVSGHLQSLRKRDFSDEAIETVSVSKDDEACEPSIQVNNGAVTSEETNEDICCTRASSHDSSRVSCPVCNVSLSSASTLSRHMRRKHQYKKQESNKILGDSEYDSGEENIEKELAKQKKLPSNPHSVTGRKIAAFSCAICNVVFVTKSLLSKHLNVKHHKLITSRRCHACKRTFSSSHNYLTHMKTQHNLANPEKYTCRHCDKVFFERNRFVAHAKVHNIRPKPAESHTCKDCGRSFKRKDVLRMHMINMHKAESNFKCEECAKFFTNQFKLDVHIARKHTGKRTFTCEYCAKSFYTHEVLKVHLVGKHSIKTEFRCDLCSDTERFFASKSNLERHLASKHINSKEYLCSDCGLAFKTQYLLRQHAQKHSTEGSYKCKDCDRTFRWSSSLEAHVNAAHNTGMKKLECEHCTKLFTTKSSLSYHVKKYHQSGPKSLYVCLQCDVTCSTKGTIHRHIRNKHVGLQFAEGTAFKVTSTDFVKPKRARLKKVEPPNTGVDNLSLTNPESLCQENQISYQHPTSIMSNIPLVQNPNSVLSSMPIAQHYQNDSEICRSTIPTINVNEVEFYLFGNDPSGYGVSLNVMHS